MNISKLIQTLELNINNEKTLNKLFRSEDRGGEGIDQGFSFRKALQAEGPGIYHIRRQPISFNTLSPPRISAT